MTNSTITKTVKEIALLISALTGEQSKRYETHAAACKRVARLLSDVSVEEIAAIVNVHSTATKEEAMVVAEKLKTVAAEKQARKEQTVGQTIGAEAEAAAIEAEAEAEAAEAEAEMMGEPEAEAPEAEAPETEAAEAEMMGEPEAEVPETEAPEAEAKKPKAKAKAQYTTIVGTVIKATLAYNPRRVGSYGHRSYAVLLANPNGISYKNAIDAGARSVDLRWDIAHGNAEIISD